MRAMQAQMAGVLAAVEAKTPNTVEAMIGRTASPFTQAGTHAPASGAG